MTQCFSLSSDVMKHDICAGFRTESFAELAVQDHCSLEKIPSLCKVSPTESSSCLERSVTASAETKIQNSVACSGTTSPLLL